MSNHRLHPTLADYVAIAINPVLVMGLVGSLIYFLLEVLYQGNYPDRLQFCLSMFIIGTVLISRIAMEDGFEHAAPFGAALAVVVALALNRFVEYGDGALAHFGWAINWGLMALTWWCAHQLTWDCTVLDETDEPESQGLLETVGIDKATAAQPAVSDPQPAGENRASDESTGRRARVLAGWEQVLGRKGRPHAPGVWVVYFSLASLPIFGIGQLCIPASQTASRRYVFGLLCVYVACGLGLLLTTSFLALRRYLRRRRLEMPPIMAGTWLLTGGILIVVLLLVVALLPRPNPEYAISELPLKFSSRQQSSSKLAVGEEGTSDKQAASGAGVDHARDPAAPNDPPDGAGKQASPDGRGSTAAGEKSDSPGSGSKGSEKGDRSQAGNAGDKTQAGQSQPQPNAAQSDASTQTDSPAKQNAAAKSPDQASQQNGAKPPPNSQPSSRTPPDPAGGAPAVSSVASAVAGFLAATFKWLFYAAVIAAIAWFGWQSREKLLAILQDWLAAWREFWGQLWGRSKLAADGSPLAAAAETKRRLGFVDYVDPFLAGSARQHSPDELVKYTFAALEAWGRDHGCERPPDATPHEFARQVGSQFQSVAAGAGRWPICIAARCSPRPRCRRTIWIRFAGSGKPCARSMRSWPANRSAIQPLSLQGEGRVRVGATRRLSSIAPA